MNTKQLQYIVEQQKENIITIPTITLRSTIDSSIIKELEVVYNPPLAGAETEFKNALNDVSLPNDFLDNTKMIAVIRKFGSEAVMIYMYLHAKMCREGYRITWDEIQKDVISATLSGVYTVEKETITQIMDEFIKLNLLYVISDEESQYLTSLYQIYMYERVSAKRLRDRIYKRNEKIHKKEDKFTIVTKLPVLEDEPENVENYMDELLEGWIGENGELPFV